MRSLSQSLKKRCLWARHHFWMLQDVEGKDANVGADVVHMIRNMKRIQGTVQRIVCMVKCTMYHVSCELYDM